VQKKQDEAKLYKTVVKKKELFDVIQKSQQRHAARYFALCWGSVTAEK
jgi:hypothetical protein